MRGGTAVVAAWGSPEINSRHAGFEDFAPASNLGKDGSPESADLQRSSSEPALCRSRGVVANQKSGGGNQNDEAAEPPAIDVENLDGYVMFGVNLLGKTRRFYAWDLQ